MTLDAVGLEVMAHAFASVAEEMGLVLVHSALSPNIRERRDASAALFDADGEMIAVAEFNPAQIGGMPLVVQSSVRELSTEPLEPGDGHRSIPAAQEQGDRNCADRNHVGIFSHEEHGVLHA